MNCGRDMTRAIRRNLTKKHLKGRHNNSAGQKLLRRFTTEKVGGIVFGRMDKLDQILQVVGENKKTLADIDVHLFGLDARF